MNKIVQRGHERFNKEISENAQNHWDAEIVWEAQNYQMRNKLVWTHLVELEKKTSLDGGFDKPARVWMSLD